MAKKSNVGLLTLVTGIAAGAAALFLSKKENRDKTKKVIDTATKRVKKLKADFDKNPEKTVAELKKEGRKLANKAVKAVKTKAAATKKAVETKKTKAATKKAPVTTKKTAAKTAKKVAKK